jgi:molecular chaperone DnaJ
MATTRDFYEVLGVDRAATADDIRRAYLKLAHKYHPDKTGGDKEAEERLKEINAAYDTLKNPDKRAKYDQFGDAASQFGGGAGFGGFGAGFDSPFEDFFDVLFGRGGGGRRGAAVPGNDLEFRMTLTLREAAFGVKKDIQFARMELCGECAGSGAAAGSRPETCPECGGAGQVRAAHGFFSVTRTCSRCRGAGRIVASPCRRCNGAGRVRTQRDLSVDIPAGVDTGSRLRVSGEGEPGSGGGPRGDLYVFIEVEQDELFTREGNTLICEIPVSFPQAALGDTIRVPTLTGEAELKIPAGTQSGTIFRLRGMGIVDLRGYSQGDQLVKVKVETPTRLSREQRDLLKRFEELSDSKTYPLHRRFMDALKRNIGG